MGKCFAWIWNSFWLFVKACPVGVLSQENFGAPQINYDKCIGCGKCAKLCHKKALVLQDKDLDCVLFANAASLDGASQICSVC